MYFFWAEPCNLQQQSWSYWDFKSQSLSSLELSVSFTVMKTCAALDCSNFCGHCITILSYLILWDVEKKAFKLENIRLKTRTETAWAEFNITVTSEWMGFPLQSIGKIFRDMHQFTNFNQILQDCMNLSRYGENRNGRNRSKATGRNNDYNYINNSTKQIWTLNVFSDSPFSLHNPHCFNRNPKSFSPAFNPTI